MSHMNRANIITGLDLGTTKICVVVAEVLGPNSFNILGYGVAKSEGLHKGIVANITKTAESIKEAVKIASIRAGVDIDTVNVGVAGEHISSMRHRNFVTITNEEHEITKSDLERLDADVRTIRIPSDMQILHVIPEEFIVDSTGGVIDPVGMSATKLEATNHVVLASVPAMNNIRKSIERAELNVGSFILQPLASAASILDDNEKDLGVLMIDIGGGTTDLAIIHHKAIVHSKVFGIAGNQVTNDIREMLGVTTEEAEYLKKEFGYALESAIIKDEEIIIKGVGAWGNSRTSVSLLTQIINARMKELFNLIDNEIRSSGLKNKIRAGIILTGGGSLLRGTCELAHEIFGMPARIGIPMDMFTGSMNEIEKPEFATAVGLLRGVPGQVLQRIEEPGDKAQKKKKKEVKKKTDKDKKSFVGQFWSNIRMFFRDL